jgi:two-component system, OmpR family, sensor kinase
VTTGTNHSDGPFARTIVADESVTDIDVQGTERADEIGEMARAAVVFQRNAIELMVSQRGLAQQASMLEERLAAEQRLTEMQRNFVSMASHEFRTPLTIIDGNARRLVKLSERAAGAEIVQRAGRIRAAVLRVTHLMDNLLNTSTAIEDKSDRDPDRMPCKAK